MAHIDKATRLQAVGLFRHDMRLSEEHSNINIDKSKSKNNYNLIDDNPLERYQKRLDELYVLNRKDVNTLAEIVISVPEEIKYKAKARELFFKTCTQNFIDYFGKENVVSAAVHMDETTPHIHLKAIPVYYNEKKQREQVSFDKKCPRDFYKNYHNDLSKDVEKALGYKVSILKDDTIKRNKTLAEFKKLNPTEKLKLFTENVELKQKNQELKNKVQVLEQGGVSESNELYNQINKLENKVEHLENQNKLMYNLLENIIDKVMEHAPKLHVYLCDKFSNYRNIADNMNTSNNYERTK